MRHRVLPIAALILAGAAVTACSTAAGSTATVLHIQVIGDNSPSMTADLPTRHRQYLVAAIPELDGQPATLSMTYHGASTDTACHEVIGELPDRASGQDPDWVEAANVFIADTDELMQCAVKTMGPTGSFVFDPRLIDPNSDEVWVLSDGMVNDATWKFRPNLDNAAWVRNTARQLTSRGTLDGKTVRWFGLGAHANLNRVQAANLNQLWTQIIEHSGGSVEFTN